MADHPVFLYTAAYSDLADAELDYEALKELHEVGIVGTYDAALIRKDADGKVHVHKREKPTQHGAWGGAAAGALIGLIFPPSIIGTAIVGSVVGGVAGHLWKGMSRGDLKDVGELLDEGQAALVVVGESKAEEAIEKAITRADKELSKELDVESKDLEKELEKEQKEQDAAAS